MDSFQEAGRVTADGERPAFNKVKSAATTALTDQGSEKPLILISVEGPKQRAKSRVVSIFFDWIAIPREVVSSWRIGERPG